MTDCPRFQLGSNLTLQSAYDNGNVMQIITPLPLTPPPGQPALVLGSSLVAGALPVTMYFGTTSYVVFSNNSLTFESGPLANTTPAAGPFAIQIPVSPTSQDAARALSGPAAAIVFPPAYQWSIIAQLTVSESATTSTPILQEFIVTGNETAPTFTQVQDFGTAFTVATNFAYAPGLLTITSTPSTILPIIWSAKYSLVVNY